MGWFLFGGCCLGVLWSFVRSITCRQPRIQWTATILPFYIGSAPWQQDKRIFALTLGGMVLYNSDFIVSELLPDQGWPIAEYLLHPENSEGLHFFDLSLHWVWPSISIFQEHKALQAASHHSSVHARFGGREEWKNTMHSKCPFREQLVFAAKCLGWYYNDPRVVGVICIIQLIHFQRLG